MGGCREAAQRRPQDHRIERGMPQVRQAARRPGVEMVVEVVGGARVTQAHSRAEDVGGATTQGQPRCD